MEAKQIYLSLHLYRQTNTWIIQQIRFWCRQDFYDIYIFFYYYCFISGELVETEKNVFMVTFLQ